MDRQTLLNKIVGVANNDTTVIGIPVARLLPPPGGARVTDGAGADPDRARGRARTREAQGEVGRDRLLKRAAVSCISRSAGASASKTLPPPACPPAEKR